RTQADRSWVRAGGQALELFLEEHYSALLADQDIEVVWLRNSTLASAALESMDVHDDVGGSKLDLALYKNIAGERVIFGGIHVKSSLAERVTDDVPCSLKMMEK